MALSSARGKLIGDEVGILGLFIYLFGSTIQSAREIQINRRKNPPVGGKAAQIFLNLNFKLQLQLHHRTGTQTHPAPERSHDPNKHIQDMKPFLEVAQELHRTDIWCQPCRKFHRLHKIVEDS